MNLTWHDVGQAILMLAVLVNSFALIVHNRAVKTVADDLQALGQDVDALFPPADEAPR